MTVQPVSSSHWLGHLLAPR